MNDTHFHDDHTMVVPRRATGYAPAGEEGEGGEEGEEYGFRIDMSNFEQTGDGAVYTMVGDLVRLGLELLRADGRGPGSARHATHPRHPHQRGHAGLRPGPHRW
ncbi:hypothetical protein BH20GEM2_BH20GEM2_05220 [soil metagenome]